MARPQPASSRRHDPLGAARRHMSALLLAIAQMDQPIWAERFRKLAPHRPIRTWPDDVGDPAEVAYVCAWKSPRGLLAKFPNLKAVFSLGAGVDHLMADP